MLSMELLPWAEDEQELLGEALSLIADWDDGVAGAATDARVPRGTAHEPPSRPTKINLSRERQKQEIRALQTCVVQLEEHIAWLRSNASKRARLEAPPRAPSAEANTSIVAWENAARRQFRARKKAEYVNATLREMLATQRAVADDLVRVLQRAERARQDAHAMAMFPVDPSMAALQDPVSDQQLQMRLMKISAEWHVPFTKCDKFHDQPGRPRELLFHDVITTYNDRDELVMDVRASTPMTFPPQSVADVLWEYFLKMRCSEDDFSLATDSREAVDTLVGCLRACASHDGILGELNSRFMKQRFRNMDGELVIATALNGRPNFISTKSTTSGEPQSKFEADLFEDSWLRVLCMADPHAPSGAVTPPTITVIQHVRRTRVQFRGANRPDRALASALEKFMMRLAENELRWGQEVMDRSLMVTTSAPRG